MKIEFHREKVAKAVGSLARELGGGSRRGAARRRGGEAFDVQGLLVNERFTKRLLSPDELDEYTLVSEDRFSFVVFCLPQEGVCPSIHRSIDPSITFPSIPCG